MDAKRRTPMFRMVALFLLATWSGSTLLAAPTVAESVMDIVETGDPRMIEALLPSLDSTELATAERTLRRYLEQNPHSAVGHETLGTALAFARRFDEAGASLQDAVRIDPARATAYTKLGEIAHSRGRREEAVAFYRQAIEADPDETRANQHLGLYYEAQGDDGAAIRHLERGLAGAPDDYLGVRLNLARLYARSGSPERSIALLEPFARDLERHPAVHRVIGGAYAETGQFEAAVRHLFATVRLSPGDDAAFEALRGALEATGHSAGRRIAPGGDTPGAAFQRGVAYEWLGRLADARQSYEEALALEAGFWPASNNLSVILLREGQLEEGLNRAQRAAEGAGEHGAVLHTLGWAQYLSSRPREAVATLERARAAMPDVAVVNYHLGRAYAAAGEIERGRGFVARALELDPDFEYAGDARAFLRHGGVGPQ